MKPVRSPGRTLAPFALFAFALIAWFALVMAVGAQATAPAKPAKMIPPEFKLVLEPRALDLLKATCAKLAAAKSMSFTATVGYQYPSKLGPPIVYTSRYDVAMQRRRHAG